MLEIYCLLKYVCFIFFFSACSKCKDVVTNSSNAFTEPVFTKHLFMIYNSLGYTPY